MPDTATQARGAHRCAVCRAEPEPVCGWCGWSGADDAAGAASVRTRWDMRAAHLAAGGRDGDLVRAIPLVRGTPDADDIEAAGAGAFDRHHRLDDRWSVVATLLRAVYDGELGAVAFVTIDADGARQWTIDLNPVGTARLIPAGEWLWPDLANGDPVAQRFRLAGGVGRPLGPEPDELVAQLTGALPPGPDTPDRTAVVVLLAEPGWPVLARITDVVARTWRAATAVEHSIGDIGAFLEALVRQVPLRTSHEVVLLEPGADGATALVPRVVFRGGEPVPSHRDIELYAPAGPSGPLTVPIVVSGGDPSYPAWTALRLPRYPLTRGTCGRMRVRLDARGDIVVAVDGRALDRANDDRRGWPGVLESVPRRIDVAPMDVVFLVERVLDGERLALARAAVEGLAHEARPADRIRIGVVGYAQHSLHGDRSPLMTEALGPASRFADATGDWITIFEPVANVNDYAAAMEDALVAAGAMHWRPGVRRVLVTIGSRGPYPDQSGDHAGACTFQYCWDAAIDALEPIDRIAVWREPAVPTNRLDDGVSDRANRAWTELGRFARSTTEPSVNDLIRTIGAAFSGATNPLAYASARSPA